MTNNDLPGVDLDPRHSLRDAYLCNVDLSGADLRGRDLRGSSLSGANLQFADLTSADLRYANLSGADLSGANMSLAHLRCTRADEHTTLPDDKSLLILGGYLCRIAIGIYCDTIVGLPSGVALYNHGVPRRLIVGCWRGTPDELRDLIATDFGWPEAVGLQCADRRPGLAQLADYADQHWVPKP